MKRTIYILFAAVLLLSCGAREIKDARKILDNVESYIQEDRTVHCPFSKE